MPQFKLRSALLTTFLVLASVPASAGFLRYDLNFNTNSSTFADIDGYLLFDDAAPLGSDIWPYLTYWEFDLADLGGPLISPTNTLPNSLNSFFDVDATGTFDENSMSFIAFCSSGNCLFGPDPINLSLQNTSLADFGGVIFPPDYEEIFIGATLTVSGPVIIPAPATLALVPAALVLMVRCRKRQHGLRTSFPD